MDAESLSHAQGTHEHVKEMQQTGPSNANPASWRMSLMRRGVGLQLNIGITYLLDEMVLPGNKGKCFAKKAAANKPSGKILKAI